MVHMPACRTSWPRAIEAWGVHLAPKALSAVDTSLNLKAGWRSHITALLLRALGSLFAAATDLPYFHPHLLRSTTVQHYGRDPAMEHEGPLPDLECSGILRYSRRCQ